MFLKFHCSLSLSGPNHNVMCVLSSVSSLRLWPFIIFCHHMLFICCINFWGLRWLVDVNTMAVFWYCLYLFHFHSYYFLLFVTGLVGTFDLFGWYVSFYYWVKYINKYDEKNDTEWTFPIVSKIQSLFYVINIWIL